MRDRLGSILTARAFTVFSVLVLIVGVVAFATVRLGGDGGSSVEEAANTEPLPEEVNPADTEPKPGPVPPEAQRVAGEFILAAVGREDLDKAWDLSHPSLKQQCGCTKKEWMTGNIPVQYYPTGSLESAAFDVDEATPGNVILEILLSPKAGSDVPAQPFFIGLKSVGKGAKLRWLVDYWAPSGSPPVPQSG